NYNIKKNNLKDIIMPFKGTSQNFAVQFNKKIKIAFIDGDHGYEATCEDIDIVESLLVPGGWIIFDDAFTVNKGVDKAINEKIINSKKYELFNQITRKCFIARKK
ncbi:MAG: class I SAM-dependent methyltransferase, partial [Clostridium sp.]|nr:class I SAM-dependent methyltransferase [Clostridium sp.]